MGHDPSHNLLQRQQVLPALKALHLLRPPDDLAQKVGEELGRSEVLLRRLSQEARRSVLAATIHHRPAATLHGPQLNRMTLAHA